MKRLFAIVLMFAFASLLHAQAVDTTVCDILKNPQSFNGKTVRIKGTVSAGFDEFIVRGEGCGQHVNAIWLAYPEGTKAKSGPVAMLQLQPAKNFGGEVKDAARTPVTLDKSKEFKQFDSLLSTPFKGKDCPGCIRYQVSATLVGRLDGAEVSIKRDAAGKIVGVAGFGNLNAYAARLVLQSVANVAQQEIDYAKPAAAAGPGSTVSNFFISSSSLLQQPKRAIAAFGNQGDDNGVILSGMPNEVAADEEGKGKFASPDGILFTCKVDFERAKGDLMGKMLTHMGEHIADLRTPEGTPAPESAYELEYRGWVASLLGELSSNHKSLMVSGGQVLLNPSWQQESILENAGKAISAYLANEALLSK